MKFSRRAAIHGVTLAGFAFATGLAVAQTPNWPSRPITIIAPYPPGASTDFIARLIRDPLEEQLKVPVVVENRPGAGGTSGAAQVAKSDPDGYTLLVTVNAPVTMNAHMQKNFPFDPMKAFTPVATVVTDKQVMVANPKVPFDTPQELVRHAKANPGKLTYGAAYSIGPHFIMELFKIKAGVNIVHVPYRGSAPIITDLIAGQIQLTMSGKSVLLPQILSGKMKAIAVTAAERWPELPNVATLVEGGHMDFPYETSFGVVAPMGTPVPVIERLHNAINEGLQTPGVRAAIAKLGIGPKITSLQEFAATIAEEGPRWAEIVRVTGIKAAQ